MQAVPVPVEKLNTYADPYTDVQVDKPYTAINNYIYIYIYIYIYQELKKCKHISYDYYCEELTVVNHKSSYRWKTAIFFDLFSVTLLKIIACFNIFINSSITPAVLDSGNEIIQASSITKKYIECTTNSDMPVIPPNYIYVLINRSIHCSCELVAGDNFLLNALAACLEITTES